MRSPISVCSEVFCAVRIHCSFSRTASARQHWRLAQVKSIGSETVGAMKATTNLNAFMMEAIVVYREIPTGTSIAMTASARHLLST